MINKLCTTSIIIKWYHPPLSIIFKLQFSKFSVPLSFWWCSPWDIILMLFLIHVWKTIGKGVKASLIWGHAKVYDIYLWSVVGIEAYCFFSCNNFFELYMISMTNRSLNYILKKKKKSYLKLMSRIVFGPMKTPQKQSLPWPMQY